MSSATAQKIESTNQQMPPETSSVLPAELQQPVPRTVRSGDTLFEKNRATISGLKVALIFAMPACIAIFLLKYGGGGLTGGIVTGLVIETLVAGLLVALIVNANRAKGLYCYGTAVAGEVINIQAMGDGSSESAYIFIHTRYRTPDGKTFVGQAATLGKEWDPDRKQGSPIAVLYDPENPSRYATYSPGTGMAVGKAKQEA